MTGNLKREKRGGGSVINDGKKLPGCEGKDRLVSRKEGKERNRNNEYI